MDNINIKVKSVIDNPDIIEFMRSAKLPNIEKGEENYEMYKYLMDNIFKKPEEKTPEAEVKKPEGGEPEKKVEAEQVEPKKEEEVAQE